MSDPSAPSTASRPTFPVLDTLRFVGAIAVLTTHVGFHTGEYVQNGTFGVWLARLDVGVALFFVLSGFLLSRPFVENASRGWPAPHAPTYFRKRAARILPLYLVTVLAALTIIPENAEDGWQRWVSSVLLLDSYWLAELPHGLTHMWSLTAEVTFYALLPLLMWMVAARGSLNAVRLVLGGGLCVAVSVAWHLGVGYWLAEQTGAQTGLWLPGYLTWFVVGITIAYIDVERSDSSKRSSWTGRVAALGSQPGVCWTFALGLMLVASTELAGPTLLQSPSSWEALTKHLLYAAIGGLIVLTGVFASPRGGYARVMSWAPLRHLGHISYGIFCIHMLLLITVVFPLAGVEEFSGQGLRVWVVALVLSVIAAELLYRCVELPAMRRWGSTSTRRSAAAEATAQAPSASS